MASLSLRDLTSQQYSDLTGKRQLSPLQAAIKAQVPSAISAGETKAEQDLEGKRISEAAALTREGLALEKDLTQKQISSSESLQGQSLAQSASEFNRKQALEEKALAAAGKQNSTATAMSAGSMGLGALTLAHRFGAFDGLLGKTPELAKVGSEAWAGEVGRDIAGEFAGAGMAGGAGAVDTAALTAADYGVGGAAAEAGAAGGAAAGGAGAVDIAALTAADYGVGGAAGATTPAWATTIAPYATVAAIAAIGLQIGSTIWSNYKEGKAYDNWLASGEGQAYVKQVRTNEAESGKTLAALSPDQQGAAIMELINSGRYGTADIENRLDAAMKNGATFNKAEYMKKAFQIIAPREYDPRYNPDARIVW